MKNILIFFLHLLLAITPVKGMASFQDSLVLAAQEIKYDKSENLNIPEFDGEILQNLKEDSAFDYSTKPTQVNWWEKFKSWVWELWLKFWYWLVGDYQAGGFVAFLVHSLPYLIIIVIISFIGWLFYKLNPGATIFGSTKKPEIFFSEEEEIIRTKNISELMEQALARNEYRLAIRYYYLLILQRLSEAEIIAYESDKTNSDYLSEINSAAIKTGFQKATNLYDYVWYGNFEVTEKDFSKAQPTFYALKNLIPKPNV